MDSSKARRKYLRLMWEVEKRLEVLNGFISGEIDSLYLLATIESEALQLRKILELIAFASLVTHKEAYESVRKDILKDWHAKRIMRKVENLNPDFYPIPTVGVRNGKWQNLRGGFLTRKQFESLYDRCGNILHAKNPFSKVSQHTLSFHNSVPDYVARIEMLLRDHRVRLIGARDEIRVSVPFFSQERIKIWFLTKV